jgi:hypothetical protein
MSALALTFLDPVSGIVAAGIAVPTLLLLYFLKLRRRPVRVTASFLWQRAAEDLQVNAPFRWLRLSLVLLLQLLALLLLCAAIARPALSDLPPASGRVIVLLDASASMRATDAPGGASRFDDAKRRASEFLASLDLGASRDGERTEAMLMLFAREPRVLTNYTTDRGELARALDGAAATDQPGDLAAALAIVDAFGASASGDEGARAPLLALFGDGDAPEGDALVVAASEVRFVRAGPAQGEPKRNVGIGAFSARRDEADPSKVRAFARLVNASDEPVEVAPVLEVNGEARRIERVTVPGASGARAGEASISIEAPAASRAILTLRIAGDDSLQSDDLASVVIDPPGGVDVAIVAPVGEVPGRAAPDLFLREALEALQPRSLRVMTLAQHDEAILAGDARSALGVDLVIYDRVEPGSLPPLPSLSIGAGLPVEGVRLREPDEQARATRFLSWRRTDPLLRSVALGETLVARPFRLTLPDVGEGGVTRAEPLAFGDEGPLIAALTVGGVPRAIIAFELAQSTWPLDVGFAIFLANAVETLAPRAATSSARGFTTSEPMLIAPASGADRIVAQGPATLEARVPESLGSGGLVSLGVPALTGAYEVRGAAEEDAIAPVNLFDARESSIATRDSMPIATRSGSAASAGEASPREVWAWFVLAAVGFLTLEWLLFAWRMRV